MDGTDIQPGGGRRLVLGFDAGCMTCSGLAESIEDAAGGKLEIRGLNDPKMEHWRERALGKDAPWAPTLVEVGEGSVKAWTGVRMGARLARKLGPSATWKIAKILGETKRGSGRKDSPYSGLSRSQFLKGAGGAVVGMSVLSGTGSFAATAAAQEHWLSKLSFASSKELSRKEATVAWMRQARGRHLRGFLSSRALIDNPTAGRLRGGLLSVAKAGGKAAPTKATIKGVRHELKGGGQLLALAYHEGEAVMLSYRLDKPGQKTRQLSRVIEDESAETYRISAEAEGGDIFTASREAAAQVGTARSACGNCGPCYGCRCVSASKRCLFNCCAPCAFSCGNIFLCIACVGIWCPVCNSINRCCYRKACRYISGC